MLAVLLGYRSEDTQAYVEIWHWIRVLTTMTNITETLYAIRDSKGKKYSKSFWATTSQGYRSATA